MKGINKVILYFNYVKGFGLYLHYLAIFFSNSIRVVKFFNCLHCLLYFSNLLLRFTMKYRGWCLVLHPLPYPFQNNLNSVGTVLTQIEAFFNFIFLLFFPLVVVLGNYVEDDILETASWFRLQEQIYSICYNKLLIRYEWVSHGHNILPWILLEHLSILLNKTNSCM